MRHRLGLGHMPANAPGVKCFCNRHIQPTDTDHAMTCRALSGAMTLRHDILNRIWRRIAHRTPIASSAEPVVGALPGGQAAANANRPESRGDGLFVMPDALTIVDVSVVHPAASTYLRLAQTDGGAAAHRDQAKRNRYQNDDPNGYAFVPLSVETYGRMGKPAMEFLNTLATIASTEGSVDKDLFMTNALKELSIGLCRGNGVMYRRGVTALARVTGTALMTGLPVATAEVH